MATIKLKRGTGAPTTSDIADGEVAIDKTALKLHFRDGSNIKEIGGGGGTSFSTFSVDTMTGDGSDTTLTLSASPDSENNTQVYIDGVYQPKSTYSVSGTTLTFGTAPPNGTAVEVTSSPNVTFASNTMTGDGSDTTLTLSANPGTENNTLLFVGGVYQPKSTYSVSGTTLTFSAAPPNNASVEAMAGASTDTFTIASMTGDGSDTTLTLSANPGTKKNTLLFVGGVYQPKSSYSISGTTLTFNTAPPTGTSVEAIIGDSTNVNVPEDDTVTSAKLSGDLTTPGNLTVNGITDTTNFKVGGAQGSDGQVLTSTGSGVAWENAAAGGIASLVADTSPQLGGTLDANSNTIDMGTNVITDTKVGQWDTAYSWGNHASSGYATLASPTLTGTPLAPTASASTNTTQIATTAFVGTAVSNLVDSSPSALNTLNELAAALGDDANFSTTVTNSIATKLPLAGGTLTGALTLGGNLNVGAHDIVTSSNGNIELDPNGSGKVVFKGNATKGAGQFVLNCEQNSHGITIKGPPHSAAASYTLTLPNDDGSADQLLKTNGSGVLSWADASGGGSGGAWTVMSSQTVSSSTTGVTFTGVTGYKVYKVIFSDVNHSGSNTLISLSLSSDNGSSSATFGVTSISLRYNSTAESQTITNDFYYSNKLPLMHSFNEYNDNEKKHGEVTIFGLNDSSYTYSHCRFMSNWGWTTNDIGVNETYARNVSTTSMNSITIESGGYNFDSGTFTLYGLANS